MILLVFLVLDRFQWSVLGLAGVAWRRTGIERAWGLGGRGKREGIGERGKGYVL